MSEHRKGINRLSEHLYDYTGIPEIDSIEKEVLLDGKMSRIGDIDLLVKTLNGYGHAIVEYKCRDSKSNRKKARKQLVKNAKAMENLIGLTASHLFYVHGNRFTVEELVEGEFVILTQELPLHYHNL